MATKLIVLDWNGTLFRTLDDRVLVRHLAKAVLGAAARQVLRGRLGALAVFGGFALGRVAYERAKKRYDRGEIGLAELVEPFNRSILHGAPLSLIERAVDAYGAQHASLLDERMLQPLSEAHARGSSLVIYSAAYDRGIRAVLDAAGLGGAFDELVCNTLEREDGRALGLTARYRDDKAGDFKTEFLDRRGWSPSGITYAGDTFVDEPIAGLLPRGHFIVPFLAPDAFKEHMSAAYGAFVPESPDELSAYLGTM